ncbi:hypothetical protein GJ496_006118 [Pomphorhynchus laevis]|nr:hypothetical protein GJ496_006118 [Pomphorhynchus laevis]
MDTYNKHVHKTDEILKKSCQQNRRCELEHPMINCSIPNSDDKLEHRNLPERVCTMTKWLEVLKVNSSNAHGVIQAMREVFQDKFKQFVTNTGTNLINVTPYRAKSNGFWAILCYVDQLRCYVTPNTVLH